MEDNRQMKKLFLLDYKTIDDSYWNNPDNPVLQMLERYSKGIGDYEQNEVTEAIFNRLGWSNKYKDTIFSFRTIICKIIEVYSEKNVIKLNDDKRIKFYFKGNTLRYEINGQQKDKYQYSKEKLYEKAINETIALNQIMNKIFEDKELFERLKIVAGLVDSLSNFTPHPGYPFNQAKGNLENIADNLNLMIDKVQKCINDDKDLLYGNNYKIKVTVLLKWKKWFVRNQESYCLNNIYEIKDDKMVGINLFDTQSLGKPLPTNKEEILKYLDNMINILNVRGEKMNMSIR